MKIEDEEKSSKASRCLLEARRLQSLLRMKSKPMSSISSSRRNLSNIQITSLECTSQERSNVNMPVRCRARSHLVPTPARIEECEPCFERLEEVCDERVGQVRLDDDAEHGGVLGHVTKQRSALVVRRVVEAHLVAAHVPVALTHRVLRQKTKDSPHNGK
eukprot:6182857-Pleurochrysis_carterae.AAC.1